MPAINPATIGVATDLARTFGTILKDRVEAKKSANLAAPEGLTSRASTGGTARRQPLKLGGKVEADGNVKQAVSEQQQQMANQTALAQGTAAAAGHQALLRAQEGHGRNGRQEHQERRRHAQGPGLMPNRACRFGPSHQVDAGRAQIRQRQDAVARAGAMTCSFTSARRLRSSVERCGRRERDPRPRPRLRLANFSLYEACWRRRRSGFITAPPFALGIILTLEIHHVGQSGKWPQQLRW